MSKCPPLIVPSIDYMNKEFKVLEEKPYLVQSNGAIKSYNFFVLFKAVDRSSKVDKQII